MLRYIYIYICVVMPCYAPIRSPLLSSPLLSSALLSRVVYVYMHMCYIYIYIYSITHDIILFYIVLYHIVQYDNAKRIIINVYVCMYVYIYIYIYAHICIYTYICHILFTGCDRRHLPSAARPAALVLLLII